MASKFNVWVNDSNVSTATTDITNDSQKIEGFKAGTAASSTRVNTILRQNSLVATALMNIVDSTGLTSYTSPVASVQSQMQSYFNNFVPNTTTIAGKRLTNNISLGGLTLQLNGTQVQVYDGSADKVANFTGVVTTDGAQTINDAKTFTSGISVTDSYGNASVSINTNKTLTVFGTRTASSGSAPMLDVTSTGFKYKPAGSTNSYIINLPNSAGTLAINRNMYLYSFELQSLDIQSRVQVSVILNTSSITSTSTNAQVISAIYNMYELAAIPCAVIEGELCSGVCVTDTTKATLSGYFGTASVKKLTLANLTFTILKSVKIS